MNFAVEKVETKKGERVLTAVAFTVNERRNADLLARR